MYSYPPVLKISFWVPVLPLVPSVFAIWILILSRLRLFSWTEIIMQEHHLLFSRSVVLFSCVNTYFPHSFHAIFHPSYRPFLNTYLGFCPIALGVQDRNPKQLSFVIKSNNMAELWMRSSRAVKRLAANLNVLGSIPACCDILVSEGRHLKQICW
jgi:hypothetical protein